MEKKFAFLRKIKKYFSLYTSLNSGLILFQRKDLEGLQPLRDISPLYFKKMSISDESQLGAWTNVLNKAFSRNWSIEDSLKAITHNKVYDVLNTYFLMDEDTPIGIISEAVFRKNRQIGLTHYAGLDERYRNRGLGKQLLLYALHKMREHNLKSCEGESYLDFRKSLYIHFDLGFYPKNKMDYWNKEDNLPVLMRQLISYNFNRLYEKWKLK